MVKMPFFILSFFSLLLAAHIWRKWDCVLVGAFVIEICDP